VAIPATTTASKKRAKPESTGTGNAGTALAVKSSIATVLTDIGMLAGVAAIPILTTCCPEIALGTNVTFTMHPDVGVTRAPGMQVVPIGSMENCAVPIAMKTAKLLTTKGDIEADDGATKKVSANVREVPIGTSPRSYVCPFGKNTPRSGGGGHQPSDEKAIRTAAVTATRTDFGYMDIFSIGSGFWHNGS